ncbi:MAG: TolC family protein [Crocinitomicaceae bacterium]
MNNIFYIISIALSTIGSATIYAQPLDSLLVLTVENNPKLKALSSAYQAKMAKVDQVSQLADPTIGTGVPVLNPETRLGPQIVMVSAQQMFPWFGTLNAKKDVVISMSKEQYELIAAEKLELFYQVKSAYYKIAFYQSKKEIIASQLKLFEAIENIALAKVESGQTTIADALRTQVVMETLSQEIKKIDNHIRSLETVINQYTNQEWSNQISVRDGIAQIIPVDFDTAEFRSKIENHHPLIKKIDQQIETSNQELIVNKKANSPKISLGVDYSLVNPRTDASPVNNGRDILIPKVMISLPIYRKSYKSKIEEEAIKQEMYAYQKEALTDKMMRQLLQYKIDYDNALLNIQMHEKQIKITKIAIGILMTNYSSTGNGFDEVLQQENALLVHEIGLIKSYLDMQLATANIERLTNF